MSLTDATFPPEAASGLADSCCGATPARRGRVVVRLPLRHAGLREPGIAYELVGPAGAPVLIVAGGISADRHLAANAADDTPGWWEAQVGAGRALDNTRYRLLAIDWLGSDGSLDAPIDSADQADAFAAVLDHLGIARVAAFVGASYGAMVGLQFAARHPRRLGALVAISGAHKPHPFASAGRALQRRIVRAAQGWASAACAGCAGAAQGGADPRAALALARQLAMLSYRTPEEFAERFAAPPVLHADAAEVAADAYLEACGAKYAARVPATAFLRLSESIDLHAVDPATVRVPTTLVAVSEDRLVPSADLHALAAQLGATCRLHHLRSRFGHDAFLTEHARIGAVLCEALAECAP
jgi:homoserine O-acetyltransferase